MTLKSLLKNPPLIAPQHREPQGGLSPAAFRMGVCSAREEGDGASASTMGDGHVQGRVPPNIASIEIRASFDHCPEGRHRIDGRSPMQGCGTVVSLIPGRGTALQKVTHLARIAARGRQMQGRSAMIAESHPQVVVGKDERQRTDGSRAIKRQGVLERIEVLPADGTRGIVSPTSGLPRPSEPTSHVTGQLGARQHGAYGQSQITTSRTVERRNGERTRTKSGIGKHAGAKRAPEPTPETVLVPSPGDDGEPDSLQVD